jgi:hypothetical protein
MPLFGSLRDLCIINDIGQEVLNLASQRCIYYKFKLDETKVNIYGESTGTKIYFEPVVLDALIERFDQTNPTSDIGVDYTQLIDFKFQRPKLKELGLLCEPGDIIMYNEDYFEVDEVIQNRLFLGNDEDFSYPIEGEDVTNEKAGESITIVCKTHYVPADRVQITEERR